MYFFCFLKTGFVHIKWRNRLICKPFFPESRGMGVTRAETFPAERPLQKEERLCYINKALYAKEHRSKEMDGKVYFVTVLSGRKPV